MAYGRWDRFYVDTAPVKAHVKMLSKHGIGYKTVAKLSGVSTATVHCDRPTMRNDLAQKILAVQPGFDEGGSVGRMSARGVHRRVQALALQGWSYAALARQLGMFKEHLQQVMTQKLVHRDMHAKIAALYDELRGVDAPRGTRDEKSAYVRTQNRARRMKYQPWIAWEDIDLDEKPWSGLAAADAVPTEARPQCIIPDCENTRVRSQLCRRHYRDEYGEAA